MGSFLGPKEINDKRGKRAHMGMTNRGKRVHMGMTNRGKERIWE
jgi:hypothetical protein